MRRPVGEKIDRRLTALIEATVTAELERRVRPALEATATAVNTQIERTDELHGRLHASSQEHSFMLDSLVRELVRLQAQLEVLSHEVLDHDHDHAAEEERLLIG